MRRLLWFGAWTAVAIWSLFALLTYNVLDFAGGLAMRNADAFSSDPETVEWIWRVFSWIHGLSTSIALVVWGVVSLAILAVPWFLDRVIGRPGTVRPAGPSVVKPGFGQGGVVDLTPDQYSVRTDGAGAAPQGPVPRIHPPR
jgi:hypothetical protein